MAIAAVKITVAGQEYNAAYNSTSGKWEATLTAPSITSYNLGSFSAKGKSLCGEGQKNRHENVCFFCEIASQIRVFVI
ncbi:MAG: hypothetical protein LBL83_14175 [Clostridiales bacterium]|jgi:hypothetical protein|nr:hypothetical protein [Clostridiales bacterium]